MTDREKYAWVAGIIDADGCVRFRKRGYPIIQIGMCDEKTIRTLADIFGVNALGPYKRKLPNRQDLWQVGVYNRQALRVAQLTVEFAVTKRQRLLDVIEYYALKEVV